MADFRNLDVWQHSMNLTMHIYDITDSFPTFERYGLASQMQRAATSIPSNIAEGYGRQSDRELYHFLHISRGSLYEIQTQLYIAYGRKYISDEELQNTMALLNRVGRLITGFLNSLERTDPTLCSHAGPSAQKREARGQQPEAMEKR